LHHNLNMRINTALARLLLRGCGACSALSAAAAGHSGDDNQATEEHLADLAGKFSLPLGL
jgi:hypothetical protein